MRSSHLLAAAIRVFGVGQRLGRGTDLPIWNDTERRGGQGTRHGRVPLRQAVATGTRHRERRRYRLRAEVPVVSRAERHGHATASRPHPAGQFQASENPGKPRAVCDDGLGLHQPGDAVDETGIADARRSLTQPLLTCCLNEVIDENAVLDATTLPTIKMPNRDNFVAVELDWKPGQRRPLGHYP